MLDSIATGECVSDRDCKDADQCTADKCEEGRCVRKAIITPSGGASDGCWCDDEKVDIVNLFGTDKITAGGNTLLKSRCGLDILL